jgi:hypothetical protein
VIENIALRPPAGRRNLQLPVHSGIYRVINPGKPGSNHLLSPHCETMTLSFANPDGMTINGRRQPRPTCLAGVFFIALDGWRSALLANKTLTFCSQH